MENVVWYQVDDIISDVFNLNSNRMVSNTARKSKGLTLTIVEVMYLFFEFTNKVSFLYHIYSNKKLVDSEHLTSYSHDFTFCQEEYARVQL